jgi:glutathione synthase/RimK-type ligase-like ATP-grasp enzyme
MLVHSTQHPKFSTTIVTLGISLSSAVFDKTEESTHAHSLLGQLEINVINSQFGLTDKINDIFMYMLSAFQGSSQPSTGFFVQTSLESLGIFCSVVD